MKLFSCRNGCSLHLCNLSLKDVSPTMCFLCHTTPIPLRFVSALHSFTYWLSLGKRLCNCEKKRRHLKYCGLNVFHVFRGRVAQEQTAWVHLAVLAKQCCRNACAVNVKMGFHLCYIYQFSTRKMNPRGYFPQNTECFFFLRIGIPYRFWEKPKCYSGHSLETGLQGQHSPWPVI